MIHRDDDSLSFELRGRLYDLCQARADQLLARSRQSVANRQEYGMYGNTHAPALALLRAHTEIIASLNASIESLIYQAVRGHAHFAEIGSACAISRQAARQRYQRFEAARRRRQEEFRNRRADGEYGEYWDDDPANYWPPSPWRTRAPLGFQTVRLHGGPFDGRDFRVEVGADAYPHIDSRALFGRIYARYAYYRPRIPGSDQYLFTGDYYLI